MVENAGIALSPDQEDSTDPGKTITYNHVLTNTGDLTDTYDLSVDSSQGWTVSVSPDPTVDSGESSTFKVTVLVPAGTLAGVQDELILTAVSQLDPSVSATSTDTTTVNQVAGVSLSS